VTEGQSAAGQVRFTPSRALYPFESRWFESGAAGRVHYLDEGSGQPILMLHGNPTWSFLYRHVIGLLRDRFRCIALDYHGFGLSDRPTGYGYTPDEHAATVGDLVIALDLSELIVMAHDWGGPIGLSFASSNAKRIHGLVLGGTWFWPPDRRMRIFSRVMASWPLQRAILKRNLFVERFIPSGINRTLTEHEMDHYRGVLPTAASRVGVAEFPRQIVKASRLLAELGHAVPERLGTIPTLITYPMQDAAFRPNDTLPLMRAAFRQAEVVELTEAKHYFVEDAPDEVAGAIASRFL
jgi:haloalkane dehalogenase